MRCSVPLGSRAHGQAAIRPSRKFRIGDGHRSYPYHAWACGRGHRYVVDADIKAYFDSIDQDLLMGLVSRRISDKRVLRLLRQWLRAGVMDAGEVKASTLGTPQGGVISPLLANIYLDALDRVWERQCSHLGRLIRYADDFVVLCRTRVDAEEALRRLRIVRGHLRLTLHPDKTRLVDLGVGKGE